MPFQISYIKLERTRFFALIWQNEYFLNKSVKRLEKITHLLYNKIKNVIARLKKCLVAFELRYEVNGK